MTLASAPHAFSTHSGPCNVARFNSHGRYVLTAGSDRLVKLFNSASQGSTPIQTYTSHSHEVFALDISPDNSKFASGGKDKAVLLWDVATGKVLRRFSEHTGKIESVAFGGVGGESVLAVAGFDGAVRLYDLKAQGAWRPIMVLKEAKDSVMSLALNDSHIYTGSVDGKLRTYDLRAGELRTDLIDQPITSVTPSSTGSTVLVSSLDSTTRLFDAKDGSVLQTFRGQKHTSYRCRAVFANKEDIVVMGDEEGRLHAWDVVSGDRSIVGQAHKKAILWTDVAPDPNGPSQTLTAGADGIVNIYNLDGK